MNTIWPQYCSVYAFNVIANEIKAMLLMSTASYTHWIYPDVVT